LGENILNVIEQIFKYFEGHASAGVHGSLVDVLTSSLTGADQERKGRSPCSAHQI